MGEDKDFDPHFNNTRKVGSLEISKEMARGVVIEEEDLSGHVGLLARGIGIPAVTGLGGSLAQIYNGDRVLIRNLDVIINPDLATVEEFDSLRRAADPQLSLDLQ